MIAYTIGQAAANGIDRLRKPYWANLFEHIKIDIIEGNKPGPWLHFYSPMNKILLGRDPYDLLIMYEARHDETFEPYTGPLPDSKEYLDDVKWVMNMREVYGLEP
jgi:hypothetical protein